MVSSAEVLGAAEAGNAAKLAEYLLDDKTAVLNSRTAHGGTALHAAVAGKKDNREAVKVLLSVGLNPHEFDKNGETPYELAEKRNHMESSALMMVQPETERWPTEQPAAEPQEEEHLEIPTADKENAVQESRGCCGFF